MFSLRFFRVKDVFINLLFRAICHLNLKSDFIKL